MILGRFFSFRFVARNDTSTYPLLTWYANGFIAIIMGCLFGGRMLLALDRSHFTVVLNLDGGQEVILIFMS